MPGPGGYRYGAWHGGPRPAGAAVRRPARAGRDRRRRARRRQPVRRRCAGCCSRAPDGPARAGRAAPQGAPAGPRRPPPRPAGRHPGAGPRAAGPGAGGRAAGAVPRPGRRGPVRRGRSWTRCRTTRPGRCASSSDYQWRSRRGAAGVRGDQGPAAPGGAGQPVPRHEGGAARRRPAQDVARVRDMLAELNEMLEADARGEHTQEQFDRFMEQYGDFFPERPAEPRRAGRRAGPPGRGASSGCWTACPTSSAQELADLMAGALGDVGLAGEMDRLQRQLRAARPDLRWGGRERMDGDRPLGLGDATSALQELADLDELEATLDQDYPGASLDDVDEEPVERALGRQAVDDLEALRRMERELEQQGYLNRSGGALELTAEGRAPARRDRAAPGLRRAGVRRPRRPRRAGTPARPGEPTGSSPGAGSSATSSRSTSSARSATPCSAPAAPPILPGHATDAAASTPEIGAARRRVRLTSRTSRWSRPSGGRRPRSPARRPVVLDGAARHLGRGQVDGAGAALAGHHEFPQDAIEIIGFSQLRPRRQPTELAGLAWDMVQGTNLQHALMLAGRHLDQHPDGEPVVLVVTDGEPTAHLARDGRAEFAWPPLPETLALTMAEVDRCTRRGATINVFMLDDDPRLVRFVEELARRNGGRVFCPTRSGSASTSSATTCAPAAAAAAPPDVRPGTRDRATPSRHSSRLTHRDRPVRPSADAALIFRDRPAGLGGQPGPAGRCGTATPASLRLLARHGHGRRLGVARGRGWSASAWSSAGTATSSRRLADRLDPALRGRHPAGGAAARAAAARCRGGRRRVDGAAGRPGGALAGVGSLCYVVIAVLMVWQPATEQEPSGQSAALSSRAGSALRPPSPARRSPRAGRTPAAWQDGGVSSHPTAAPGCCRPRCSRRPWW